MPVIVLVTIPPSDIEAMPVLLLFHVPPVIPSYNIVAPSVQNTILPVIPGGTALIVTVVVLEQPVVKV